jgi:glycosyltransferase involved in cell wall biosynthesis
MKAKLTIAIPIWNGKSLIKPLLASLNKIKNLDFEVLIHENPSNDNLNLLEYNLNFKYNYTLHGENIGLDKNILTLWREVKTDYVWFIGCDDDILIQDLKLLNDLLDFNYSAFLLNWKSFREESIVNERGIRINNDILFENFKEQSIKLGPQFFLSSFIIRKSEVDIDEYFNSQTKNFFHWYLFIKSTQQSQIYFVNSPIVRHCTGNESYLSSWIAIFFIDYPKFIQVFDFSKDLKGVLLKYNYNLSMSINIINKRKLFGNISKEMLKNIYKYNIKNMKFLFFILIPLLLPQFIIVLLDNIRKQYKSSSLC